MPPMIEQEANNAALEAEYREYKKQWSKDEIEQAANKVTRLINDDGPAVFQFFLESFGCPKHPIFLNDTLREVILAQSFTSEQKVELVRIFLQDQELVDFMQRFPKRVFGRGQIENFIDYTPASQAALSDLAILKLFIDIDNGQTVINGCLSQAARNKQIDALKLILDKCTTPDEIESLYNSLLENYEEQQRETSKLKHMQRIIDNNLDRMRGTPFFMVGGYKLRGVEAAALHSNREACHAQSLIFDKKFAEAKQYLLEQKNKPNSPWSKYEHVYMFMFQSIVANSIKEETEDLLELIRFLFADPKFTALFSAWNAGDFKEPMVQMIINNSMQVVRFLIAHDDGETVAKLNPLDLAIKYVNVPMFEMLVQNSTIVAAACKDAVLDSLNDRLEYYGDGLELQKQVIDLLDTKHKELLANESAFSSAIRRVTKAAKLMHML